MISGTLNGQSVTIVGIIPNGNNVMVSYIDATANLCTTLVNFDPRHQSTALIATSATLVTT